MVLLAASKAGMPSRPRRECLAGVSLGEGRLVSDPRGIELAIPVGEQHPHR
jgi:hypothetical protein